MATYDRRAVEAPTPPSEEILDDVGELDVAEWIVMLLAFDTYYRTVKEKTGIRDPHDPVIQKGVTLLRTINSLMGDAFHTFLSEHMPSEGMKKMLAKAFRLGTNRSGLPRQALQIRTVLSRGGASTVRKVFKSNRAIQEVRTAIQSSQFDDGAQALDKFAVISIRNSRIRTWIDLAAKTAGAGSFQGAVDAASSATADAVKDLAITHLEKTSGSAASEESHKAAEVHKDRLVVVQETAAAAAKKALEVSGHPDIPTTRSETVGIATAAAAAAVASQDAAVPEALRKLDPEQREAAMANGKVLVAAGAGSGKSTTLVARIKYLVEDKKSSPSRILACSFNAKAAEELRQKINKSLGETAGKSVMVGTMNSLFQRFIVGNPKTGFAGFGSPEEKAMLSGNRLIAPPRKQEGQQRENEEDTFRGRKPTPLACAVAIRGIWAGCDPEALAAHMNADPKIFESGPPKAKMVNTYISKWQGNDVSLEEVRRTATKPDEFKAALWYELYLGLKGDLGRNWRPPCGSGSKPFMKFMNDFRKGGERLGDLNDQIKVLRDILRRDPSAKKALQGKFDHLLVDECQDLNGIQHEIFDMMSEHIDCDDKERSISMIGDDKQCVSKDTPVLTPLGTKEAGSLATGDQVIAYRNGELISQTVRHVVPSAWSWGYRITTESGKTILMSPNHKLWATSPEMGGDRTIVYLMHRKDMGFRVGITNKCEDPENPFGSRANLEHAERLWVLDLCDTREEALYREEFYSLKYGVPTMVFEGAARGLNQVRIARVFAEFGNNGSKLLEDRHLSFDLPNWMAYSYTKFGTKRRTIQFVMHAAKGSQVALEWMGEDLAAALTDVRYERLEGGRNRLRRFFTNYRDALAFAEDLKAKTGAGLRKRLSTPEGPMAMLTASALVPTMSVAVRSGDTIIQEQIISIVKTEGSFVDLDVTDASNFFGGDILTSNSIYQFRGAKPSKFTALHHSGCWQTKMMRTNYRCEPEIVETANKLIANNPDQIPMEAKANPTKPRGEASITMEVPDSNATAAITTVGRMRKDLDTDPTAKPEHYAVLARTNAELNDFETAAIINEIPYVRRGGKGFLDAPESKAVLSYIDLASGTDYEKKAESLAHGLLHPDRGLFMGPADVEKAVKNTLDDIARRERVDVKAIDPTELLRNRTYTRMLADNLKRKYKISIVNSAKGDTRKGEWLYGKLVDELTDELSAMGHQVQDVESILSNPASKTTDLMDFILDGVKGTKKFWDKEQRRQVSETTSLRDHITNRIALFDEDSDDADETEEEPQTTEISEEGLAEGKTENPVDQGKGLGAVQFLYALMEPNKNDIDSSTDPMLASGFQKKLTRYAEMAKKLRIDPKKWAKQQQVITDPKLRQEKPPALTLSTVHSVKGMEWPNVTVVMPKGRFPMERKPKAGEPPPDPQEVAENLKAERNLGYVAVTRAAKNLEVHALRDPKTGDFSPFVYEMGLHPGQNVEKRAVELGPAVEEEPGPPASEPAVKTAFFDEEEASGLSADYLEHRTYDWKAT